MLKIIRKTSSSQELVMMSVTYNKVLAHVCDARHKPGNSGFTMSIDGDRSETLFAFDNQGHFVGKTGEADCIQEYSDIIGAIIANDAS